MGATSRLACAKRRLRSSGRKARARLGRGHGRAALPFEALEDRRLLSGLAEDPILGAAALAAEGENGQDTVWLAPGRPGQGVRATFACVSCRASYQNELGLIPVADAGGRVGGLAPGDAGYAAAALSQAGQRVIFASGQTSGAATSGKTPPLCREWLEQCVPAPRGS